MLVRSAPLLVIAATLLACVGEEAKHKAAGNILMRRGEAAQARAEFQKAVEARPGDPASRTLLGDALFELGQLEAAEREYREALRLYPKAYEAMRGLASIATRRGDHAGAERQLGELLAAVPDDWRALRAVGMVRLARGEAAAAVEPLVGALRQARDDPASLYHLGLAFLRTGRVDEAAAVYAQLGLAVPDRPFSAYGQALVAAYRKDAAGALAALDRAIALGFDPGKAAADPDLGGVRDDAGWKAGLEARLARRGNAP